MWRSPATGRRAVASHRSHTRVYTAGTVCSVHVARLLAAVCVVLGASRGVEGLSPPESGGAAVGTAPSIVVIIPPYATYADNLHINGHIKYVLNNSNTTYYLYKSNLVAIPAPDTAQASTQAELNAVQSVLQGLPADRLAHAIFVGNWTCTVLGLPTAQTFAANPNISFSCFEAFAPGAAPVPANMMVIDYAEDHAAYVTGMLAAKATTSQVVAAIGDWPFPHTKRYIAGFLSGVRAYCSSCRVHVNYLYSSTTATGAENNLLAVHAVTTLGADVVFAPASLATLDVLTRATVAAGNDTTRLAIIGSDNSMPLAPLDPLLPYVLNSAGRDVISTVRALIVDPILSGGVQYLGQRLRLAGAVPGTGTAAVAVYDCDPAWTRCNGVPNANALVAALRAQLASGTVSTKVSATGDLVSMSALQYDNTLAAIPIVSPTTIPNLNKMSVVVIPWVMPGAPDPHLVFFGGFDTAGTASDKLTLCSMTTGTCSERSAATMVSGFSGAPSARGGHFAVVLNNRMTVFGGATAFNTLALDASVYRYSYQRNEATQADSWTPVPPANLPAPRAFCATVRYLGVLYIYGGLTASGWSSDIYKYISNTVTPQFVDIIQNGAVPPPLAFPTMAAVQDTALGTVLIMLGNVNATYDLALYTFVESTGIWATQTAVPFARMHYAMVVVRNLTTPARSPVVAAQSAIPAPSLSPATPAAAAAPAPPRTVHPLAAGTVGRQGGRRSGRAEVQAATDQGAVLLVMGGRDANGVQSSSWAFNHATLSWRQFNIQSSSTCSLARQNHTAFAITNSDQTQTVLVVGGTTASGAPASACFLSFNQDDSVLFALSDNPCSALFASTTSVRTFSAGIGYTFAVILPLFALCIVATVLNYRANFWHTVVFDKMDVNFSFVKKSSADVMRQWILVLDTLQCAAIILAADYGFNFWGVAPGESPDIAFGPQFTAVPKTASTVIKQIFAIFLLDFDEISAWNVSFNSILWGVVFACVGLAFLFVILVWGFYDQWDGFVLDTSWGQYIQRQMPYVFVVLGDMLFIPIVYNLLSSFSCIREARFATTDSYHGFVSRDCSRECYTGSHLVPMLLSLFALLAYVPMATYTGPVWQMLHDAGVLKDQPSYRITFCFFKLTMAYIHAIWESVPVAHGMMAFACTGLMLVNTLRARPTTLPFMDLLLMSQQGLLFWLAVTNIAGIFISKWLQVALLVVGTCLIVGEFILLRNGDPCGQGEWAEDSKAWKRSQKTKQSEALEQKRATRRNLVDVAHYQKQLLLSGNSREVTRPRFNNRASRIDSTVSLPDTVYIDRETGRNVHLMSVRDRELLRQQAMVKVLGLPVNRNVPSQTPMSFHVRGDNAGTLLIMRTPEQTMYHYLRLKLNGYRAHYNAFHTPAPAGATEMASRRPLLGTDDAADYDDTETDSTYRKVYRTAVMGPSFDIVETKQTEGDDEESPHHPVNNAQLLAVLQNTGTNEAWFRQHRAQLQYSLSEWLRIHHGNCRTLGQEVCEVFKVKPAVATKKVAISSTRAQELKQKVEEAKKRIADLRTTFDQRALQVRLSEFQRGHDEGLRQRQQEEQEAEERARAEQKQ